MNTARPLFMLLSTVLIVSGAAMALMFGWVGYHVIFTPENIPLLTYAMGHIPTGTEATVMKGSFSGQPFEVAMPPAMVTYTFAILGVVAFGVLLAISRCLSGIGIQLFKVLAQTHREEKRPMAPVEKRAKPAAPGQLKPPESNSPDSYQF